MFSQPPPYGPQAGYVVQQGPYVQVPPNQYGPYQSPAPNPYVSYQNPGAVNPYGPYAGPGATYQGGQLMTGTHPYMGTPQPRSSPQPSG